MFRTGSRLFRQRQQRVRSRWNSDTSARAKNAGKTAEELTADEKAAEIGEMMSPKMKRYAIVLVPTLFFSIVSIDIINDENHRYWLEERFPAYVQFVRDNYGFATENYPELMRVKFTIEAQKFPNDVTIRTGNGGVQYMPSVSSDMSMSDLVRFVREKYPSDVFGLSDLDLLQSIDFTAAVADAPAEQTSGVNGSVDNNSFSGRNSHSNSGMNKSESSIASSAILDAIDGGSIGPINLRTNEVRLTSSSLWADVAAVDSKTDSRRINHDNKNKSSQSSSNRNSTGVMARFSNIMHYFTEGFQEYQLNGNGCVVELKDEHGKTRKKPKSRSASGSSSSRTVQASTSSSSIERELAMNLIRMKEQQVQALQNEKKVGRRSIDDVDAEIAQIEDDITTLKRKYVNYFYYF